MSVPKRQHYVPIMLLKHFIDENGWLYVFDRRVPEIGARRSRPEQAFLERHFYTRYTYEHAEKSYSIEHELNRMEDTAAPVVRNIVISARAGEKPNLTQQEKDAWDAYFCSQLTRIPEVRPSDEELRRLRHQVAEDILTQREWSPTAIRNLNYVVNDGEIVSQSNQNIKASLAIPKDDIILNVMRGKGIRIARIRRASRSFIIGSKPIVKVTPPGHTHLADPAVDAWLPISHDVAVTPASKPGKEELVEITNNQFVRWLNDEVFNQSIVIAGRSEVLVKSLTKNIQAGARWAQSHQIRSAHLEQLPPD